MASYASRLSQHWARVKFNGDGEPPSRDSVGEKLFFDTNCVQVKDIYSFIALPNRKEFELCFVSEDAVRRFMVNFAKQTAEWKEWDIEASVQSDIINVVVKFWTGRVSDHDVELFIKRYGDLVQPPYKPLDRFGIWYGIRKYRIKLHKDSSGQPKSPPTSVSFGPFNGRIIYPGQTQQCFNCGATDHQARECTLIKCWKCGELGHKAKGCSNTSLCNLCGGKGHSFFSCPHSFANRAKQQIPREKQDNGSNPQTTAELPGPARGGDPSTTKAQQPQPVTRDQTRGGVEEEELRPVPARGRGKGRGLLAVLLREASAPGRALQSQQPPMEGERISTSGSQGNWKHRLDQQKNPAISDNASKPSAEPSKLPLSDRSCELPVGIQQGQTKAPPFIERELKLMQAVEISLPSSQGDTDVSSSCNSSGSGECTSENDDEDGEEFDSASEELDTPVTSGKRQVIMNYSKRKRVDNKPSPPSC